MVFKTKTRTWVGLVLNPDYGTRKKITRTRHVQNKNPTKFYYKNKTKIEPGCHKKKYQKLVLNILKVIKNLTFIYTIWGLNSNKPPWKLHPNVCPMGTIIIK